MSLIDADAADKITEALIAAQRPLRRWLWVEANAITFTPQVLHEKFGDGRAMFRICSINSRPAYWIIRGCSSWGVEGDPVEASPSDPDHPLNFADQTDEISFALEDEFGCADSNETYRWEGDKIIDEETGEELTEADISYPVVNWGGGCIWGRMDWPSLEGVDLVPHPFNANYRILAP